MEIAWFRNWENDSIATSVLFLGVIARFYGIANSRKNCNSQSCSHENNGCSRELEFVWRLFDFEIDKQRYVDQSFEIVPILLRRVCYFLE